MAKSGGVDIKALIWHPLERGGKFLIFMISLEKLENNLGLWKQIVLIFFFLLATPLVIITSVFALYSFENTGKEKADKIQTVLPQNHLFKPEVLAASTTSEPEITSDISTADARVEIIKNYLRFYKSPLEPYAQLIVAESDKNNLDWRLLVAIAQQESNLCKVIPENSYNCWGWGIHTEGTLKFDSYEQAIRVIAIGLRKNYIEKGYNTIEEIMKKYTPRSDGSWAFGVNKFMEDMILPLY